MTAQAKSRSKRRIDPGGSPSLETYLREINRIPLLTREEERELARRVKEGDETALSDLVEANLRFVVSIAKQYANQGLPLEDLINEGNVGLIKAAHRFDVDRGFKFITYAVWWIRQAMLQSLADHSRIVRLPMNRASILYQITRLSRDMTQELGRPPSAEEIAQALEMPEKQVRETMGIASNSVSIDEPLSDDDNDGSIADYLTDDSNNTTDERAMHATLSSDLQRALATLSSREQQILSEYFGLDGRTPMTLEEIGTRMGLTRERIRQIKEKALQRLRHQSRAKFFQGHVDEG